MNEVVKRMEPVSKAGSNDAASLEETPNALWPEGPLKIAIVGRPNVGKSSLTNALTKSNRVIVNPVAGTTRDSVDVPLEVVTEGHKERFVLIDTAGLRKHRRVDDSIEFFSVKRAEDSIFRADIVLFVMDAETGITEQDKKIADIIVQARKGCIIVINKWDLAAPEVAKARQKELARIRSKKVAKGSEKMTTLREFGEWVQEKLFFLDYAPVIFTSATEGIHLEQLLETIRYVAGQLQQKIPTAVINKIIHDAVEVRQPISSTGLRLKFFYTTQVHTAPPTFWLFVNRKDVFSESYYKYLQDEIRKAFGFEGCPIMLIAKPRPKTINSKRTTSSGKKQQSHP
jgi:GTP-binding protein